MVGDRRVYASSFLRGMARVLDLRGAVNAARYEHMRPKPYPSDRELEAADWAVVRADLAQAYRSVRQRNASAHAR